MKVSRGIQINGIDYTDNLLSISDIDIGVRDLGFGYISDITAELVYDVSLRNVVGQTAVIGVLVNGKSYTYKGIISKQNIKDNKVKLSIRHFLSSMDFKPLKTITVTQDDGTTKIHKIPTLYGYGLLFKVKQKALYTVDMNSIPGVRKYRWLIGDKSFSGSVQEGDAYCIDDYSVYSENRNTINTNLHNWLELIEENGTWGNAGAYRRYRIKAYQINSEAIIVLRHLNVNVYGGKNEGGTISYTQIQETGVGSYVIEDKYDEIKIEYANKGQIGVYAPSVSIYSNQAITKDKTLEGYRSIRTYNYDNPADIVKDILISNGFLVRNVVTGINVKLNFQSFELYKELVNKISELGLLYIVPNLDNSFDIIPATGGISKATLTENDFIEESFSIDVGENNFDKLKVIWNSGERENLYGSGNREKEYNADYIVDQTSVDTFANNYLSYYQKQKYVSFETPINTKYLDLEVGDVITINYNRYSINQDFQILQQTIRDETIKFKCKEI